MKAKVLQAIGNIILKNLQSSLDNNELDKFDAMHDLAVYYGDVCLYIFDVELS